MGCWRGFITLAVGFVLTATLGCTPKSAPENPVSSQRDRGLLPSVSTSDALSGSLTSRHRAIIIGVDDYVDPVFPDLLHAADDAEGLGEVLQSAPNSGFDDVVVLTGKSRTKRTDLIEELIRARDELRKEDVLVVYFSGHGTRVKDGDVWRRFLLTTDSRSADLEGTAIDLTSLQDFFSSLPPARKALIVDACFSGDGKSVVRPEHTAAKGQTLNAVTPRATAMGPGEAHLYATSPGRPAREDDALGHGVYTWYLMEALSWGFTEADVDGDRVVTAYEAHDYSRGKTIAHTGAVQVPEAAFRVVGEADLVLAGNADERVRRERSLVYLYPSETDPLHGASVMVDGRFRGSLPGTVPIDAGRHHVRVNGSDGDTVSEGFVILSGGNSYSVEELTRIAQGPRGGVALRLGAFASTPMANIIGPVSTGIEIWGSRRANRGARRGLLGEAVLGFSVAPSRVVDSNINTAPRFVGWGGLGIGYQQDHRRLRYRFTWAANATVIPPSWVDEAPKLPTDPTLRPGEAGWVVFSTGPSASLAYVIDSTWSLSAEGRLHGTFLDLDHNGRQQFVPMGTMTLGIELAL
jgi:hypothetical protein